jgi:hypothetical protein
MNSQTPVALVITDQFMPEGDGWSVLQDWSAHAVPVILLSAAAPQRPPKFPQKLNFSQIKLKPFNADRLLSTINKLLVLEWETPDPVTLPKEPDQPPLELLQPLHKMIDEGAVTDIAEWLTDFMQQYPEYQTYTEKLIACNLALDFVGLSTMITRQG